MNNAASTPSSAVSAASAARSLLRRCLGAPWRMAATSYACLLPALGLSLLCHRSSYEPMVVQGILNLVFSATCLLGLTLLVASALSALDALFRLRRPAAFEALENAAVLLVTLPPIALHAWSALQQWG